MIFCKPLKLLLAVATLNLLSSCASVKKAVMPLGYSTELQAVLSGQTFLGNNVASDDLPKADLFSITPDMQWFAENAVKRGNTTFDKVKALHSALLAAPAQGGLGIIYDAYNTQVPRVAFQERHVNCLSFSLLYVALAKHVKLNAKINEVQTPPVWNINSKNSLFLMRHVNVKVELHDENWLAINSDDAVIDLEMGRYRSTYSQHYISDDVVAAQFYSNRAMELAAEGKPRDAFLHLLKALQENNQQSYVWNNLATLFWQRDLLHEAEILYRHGLALKPDDLSIITNLASLYSRLGAPKKAEQYSQLAERHRQANPYYQYTLALSAFDGGDFASALFYVKRAIDRDKQEPRFYKLTADIYAGLDQAELSAMMLKRYQKLLGSQD